MEIAIPNVEPIITTKRMALSDRPNHRIANGTKQMLGSVWMPRIRGFKFWLRYLVCTIRIPSKIPAATEIIKPSSTRDILLRIAAKSVPLENKSTVQRSTPTGLGTA